MSENLDLVRSIYADWERGEWGRGDWASPDIEYEYVGGPEPRSGTGLAGLASVMRDWLGAWEDWRVVADDYLELDGERVLVSFHFSGRGKASRVDMAKLQTNGTTLFEVGDGKITRVVQYFDRDHELADLGLTPDTGT